MATIGELLQSRKVAGHSHNSAEAGVFEGQAGKDVQVKSEQDGEGVHCAGAAGTLCTATARSPDQTSWSGWQHRYLRRALVIRGNKPALLLKSWTVAVASFEIK